VTRSDRALARAGLVVSGDSPRCPGCGGWLDFATDRDGRAIQHCDCGYRAYVPLRSGSTAASVAAAEARLLS
jgi:hypothetical protein